MSRRGKKLRFVREVYRDRPGSQTLHAFNRSLERFGLRPLRHQPALRITDIGRYLYHRRRLRNFFQLPGYAYIMALEWPHEERLFPVSYFWEIIPLCFDCWPKDYEQWLDLFRRHRIRTAFFTARQSCGYFSKTMPEMRCHWLPEAADPQEYNFSRPLCERSIDVLELGRKYDRYHAAVRDLLAEAGFEHRFRLDGQRRIFPTREELMDAWSDTKISVCFPKTVTDPIKAGGVETVTFRYFESIASGCLVIGRCPNELEDIFGYNPVVEADMNDPAGQLRAVLEDIESYQEIVDTNRRRMSEVGSWEVRVGELLFRLRSEGYSS